MTQYTRENVVMTSKNKTGRILERRILILAIILSAFIGSAVCPASAGEGKMSSLINERLREVLKKGVVVIVEEPPVEHKQFVTAGIWINAPREEVWKLVTDFVRYPEFFPEVETVMVLKSEGNARDVLHKVKSGISVLPLRFSYTLRFVLEPPGRMTWSLVGGDLKFSDGSWELYEMEGGKETVVFYRITYEIVPKGFLVKTVIKYVSEKNPVFEVAAISATALTVVKSVKDELEKNK